MEKLRLFEDDGYWIQVRDGHPVALDIFSRHYSKYHYKDGRRTNRFVGPGERIVLIGKNNDALFVWRKFRSDDNQVGINCSVFRNEGYKKKIDCVECNGSGCEVCYQTGKQEVIIKMVSSDLILQAEQIAKRRWPGERFYTYVNPKKAISANPGYCFKICGWNKCGITQARSMLIFEKNNVMDLFDEKSSGAKFSKDGKYRYLLWRIWDREKPVVMFIGLNPSTANESTDDPTIRKVKKFAADWGFGGVYMLNLFALVSPYPEALLKDPDPLGDNDYWLDEIAANVEEVIFAWGKRG